MDYLTTHIHVSLNVLRKIEIYFIYKQALSNNIYLTFIRQVYIYVLEYACEVWDGCYERDIEELEKIQLEAARIVTGLTKFANKDSLYFETGWETLVNRRKNRKLTIFYKIHNKLCPPYLINCLPPVTSDVIITLEIIRIMFHPDAD